MKNITYRDIDSFFSKFVLKSFECKVVTTKLKKPFSISRSTIIEVSTVFVRISCTDENDNLFHGQGEGRPYQRYKESPISVVTMVKEFLENIGTELSLEGIQCGLPPGAGRNALDCAFWDLQIKALGITAKYFPPLSTNSFKTALDTFSTLSLETPEKMEEEATKMANIGIKNIKIKLGNNVSWAENANLVKCIVACSPEAQIVIDANEGWTLEYLVKFCEHCNLSNILMIEQPLPSNEEHLLKQYKSQIPLFADESFHSSNDFERVAGIYQGINIKLDKTGGITEALKIIDMANKLNMQVMVGCMVSGSIAIAPAFFVAQFAEIIDLDGAQFVAENKPQDEIISYDKGSILCPNPVIWG